MVDHDLTPGGQVHYFMTAPGGEKHPGAFRVTAIEEPARREFEDYFAEPNARSTPSCP